MGYDKQTKNLKISNNGCESIEISYLPPTEYCDDINTVTVDYFLNTILLRKPSFPIIEIEKISSLHLSHCKLNDLPIACKDLNVKYLNLSFNELTSVPACLYSGLKCLEVLDLSHNMISNFEMEPECLPNLRKLKLNNNSFGKLPKWVLMFKCTSLEELNYSTNKAEHYNYLSNSYNLTIMKLKILKFKNCHLIDKDFSFLKGFKHLQYLDISNKYKNFINIFHEVDELFVKPRWKQLEVLKMNNLSLAFFPEGIAWLESLTELQINNNCISWLPSGIEFMVNLVVLDISRNDIVAIPEVITKLECLEVLKASNNYIESVPDLTKMPALRVLDLYDNLLEVTYFNYETVESIDLEDNYLDTKDLQDALQYNEKKNNLRLHSKVLQTVRHDGPKLRKNLSSSSDSPYSGSDLDDPEIDTVSSNRLDNDDEEEDWDSPRIEAKTNAQIDSDDEHWKGCEDISLKTVKRTVDKKYVADEDWMFVDAEDIA